MVNSQAQIPDEDLIKYITAVFGGFALHDIEYMAMGNKPIGGFILASCYIDQISMYRYNSNDSDNYELFVEEYMPSYKGLKLQINLRHSLIHHYVTRDFTVTTELPDNHLQPFNDELSLHHS